MARMAIQDGREETLYCTIVWAMQEGGGVPKQGGCLQIIVLILGQRPRTKRISCTDQLASGAQLAGCGVHWKESAASLKAPCAPK